MRKWISAAIIMVVMTMNLFFGYSETLVSAQNAGSPAEGIYTIESKYGGNLNIYAGIDKDGTKACIWQEDGSNEQKFRVASIGGNKCKLYVLSSGNGYGRVLDVNRGTSYNSPLKYGLSVDIWTANDAPAQEWYITDLGNGFHKIELAALQDGVLESGGSNNNSSITLQKYTGSDRQQWRLVPYPKPASTPVPPSIPQPTPEPAPQPTPVILPATPPQAPAISANGTRFSEGETVSFAWNSMQNADGYWVAVSKEPYGGSNIVNNSGKITGITYSVSGLKAGKYRANMQAENQAGLSSISNTVYFEIVEAIALRTAYVVNTGGIVLRVRSSPSLNADVIGTLAQGVQISVVGEAVNNFYPIQANGYDGWSSADYIAFEKPPQDGGNSSLSSIRTTAPGNNDVHYYSDSNIFYKSRYSPPWIKGNCTWYAWGRAWEITGSKLPNGPFNFNAHTWWDGNINSNKFKYGSAPKVGAIAVWNEKYYGYGHVAIVEKIENGKVYISESAYYVSNGVDRSVLFKYREIYDTKYLDGYIYIDEPNW